jgi:membrane protein DedA with SNARE-associated domain
MTEMIDSLPSGVVASFVAYEYLALVALFFISEAAIPLPFPSYILVLYAGFLAQQGQGNIPLILLCAVAGTVLGSWLLYWAAARGGHALVRKYGRYIRLQPDRIARAETWFNQRGCTAVILGRLIPGIRCQTSIAAGLFHVRRRVFLGSTIAAALVWTSFYLGMGFLLGSGSAWIADYLGSPYLLMALPLAVAAAFVGLKVLRSRQRTGSGEPAHPDPALLHAQVPA